MSDGRAKFILALTLLSEQPERLASFYENVVGLPLQTYDRGTVHQEWACDIGDLHFAIERGESKGANAMVSFAVVSMDAFLQRLQAHGLLAARGPESIGEASIGVWVCDPDGNQVQVIEIAYEWIQYLEDRRARGLDAVERWKAALFH